MTYIVPRLKSVGLHVLNRSHLTFFLTLSYFSLLCYNTGHTIILLSTFTLAFNIQIMNMTYLGVAVARAKYPESHIVSLPYGKKGRQTR